MMIDIYRVAIINQPVFETKHQGDEMFIFR